MKDLEDEFAGRVDLVTVEISDDPETAGILGVKAIPTLIGVAHGAEIFRETGRRTQHQLTMMLESVDRGESAPGRPAGDAGLALGAVSILSLTGVLAGPAWAPLAIGIAVLGFGLTRALLADHA